MYNLSLRLDIKKHVAFDKWKYGYTSINVHQWYGTPSLEHVWMTFCSIFVYGHAFEIVTKISIILLRSECFRSEINLPRLDSFTVYSLSHSSNDTKQLLGQHLWQRTNRLRLCNSLSVNGRHRKKNMWNTVLIHNLSHTIYVSVLRALLSCDFTSDFYRINVINLPLYSSGLLHRHWNIRVIAPEFFLIWLNWYEIRMERNTSHVYDIYVLHV